MAEEVALTNPWHPLKCHHLSGSPAEARLTSQRLPQLLWDPGELLVLLLKVKCQLGVLTGKLWLILAWVPPAGKEGHCGTTAARFLTFSSPRTGLMN